MASPDPPPFDLIIVEEVRANVSFSVEFKQNLSNGVKVTEALDKKRADNN